MIKLSKRLNKIVSFVKDNSKVADIGTDHGFVPNFLVEEKRLNKVISTDISKSSLDKSIKFASLRGNLDKIDHRVGSGLNVLDNNEVDTVIIAGMGGYLIVELLEEKLELVKNLDRIILQPMQNQDYLREYLYNNGYKIEDEAIIYEENKYFEIIVAKYTGISSNISEIYLKVPKSVYLRKDIECIGYLEYKIRYNDFILKQLEKKKDNTNIKDRIEMLEKENKEFKELLWNI